MDPVLQNTLFTSEASAHAKDLLARVTAFMDAHVFPNERLYEQQLAQVASDYRVPPIFYELQARAKAEGLWNLFLPESEYGAGLTNLDYAPMAEVMWS